MAGGTDNAGVLTDAAAYDPAEREWRVATDALPPGLAAPHARATGLDDRLFVWAAGAEPGGSPVIWRYDPGVDRWDETESPAPSPDVGTNQWLTAIDDALVLVSSQGPGGRPRLVIGEEDG